MEYYCFVALSRLPQCLDEERITTKPLRRWTEPVDWCDMVMQILKRVLIEYGVGGKTSSVYGRLELRYTSGVPPKQHKGKVTSFSRKAGRETFVVEFEDGEQAFDFKRRGSKDIFSAEFLELGSAVIGKDVLLVWRERLKEDDTTQVILESVELDS